MKTRSGGYVCQSGVGESKLGRKDSFWWTSLRIALRRFGGQRHYWICLSIKEKRAALGRRSGNHCGSHKILGRFQGAPGLEPRRRLFAFCSPIKILLRRFAFVKPGQKKLYRKDH